VLDCDGVISLGEAQPFKLPLFERLSDLNQRARRGEPVPAVTLNTGRPSPYVEAVMQAMAGWRPALYENGAGLYRPHDYQFKTTPLLTEAHQTALAEILRQVDREIVQPGLAYWQPGKSVCHSLFAHAPHTIDSIFPAVEAIVRRVSPEFVAVPAVLALNIYPAGINKGSGLHWLSRETGIDVADMAGVGDSASDVDFLRLVGQPAAPANATAEVKAVARYVSPHRDAAGTLDILNHWLR
jgi:hydroxymethylpyrimidine pyrophosphatase-like HAD family hydrolase